MPKPDSEHNGFKVNKPFRLLSKMRGRRAITRSGSSVVIRDLNKSSNDQLFVFSSSGSIEPKVDKSMSLDIGENGHGRWLTWTKNKNIWEQHFQLKDEYIVNERNLVLEVIGGRDQNNATIAVWKKHNGLNQRWIVDYV